MRPWLAAAVGVALALLAIVSRAGHREALPSAASLPGRAVADDDGPLREIVMHWVPEQEAELAPTYRDFLTTLPAATRVVFVVRRGGSPGLSRALASVGAGGVLSRARVVEVDVPIGAWSRDRALVAAPASGEARQTLLIPPRPRPGEGSRPLDWNVVPALVAAMPERFEVRSLPFAFDGGDFAVAGGRVLFDANLFARNHGRGFASPGELRDKVAASLGREVVMLGERPGDVPPHHMSMYMAPVGDHTVLVGDPSAGERLVGKDFVPGELGAETHAPLRSDSSPETQAQFDRAARDLASAGLRVVRIPTLAFEPRTYFAYTNGVFESRDGARTAWVPRFDVPALDAAAFAVYASLGFRVVPVSVRALYTQHGTLGCLVNVVSRGD